MVDTLLKKPINVADAQAGHKFSEISHYEYLHDNHDGTHAMQQMSTGDIIHVSGEYIENLMNSAEQYQSEVKVGLEDKHWTARQIKNAVAAGKFSEEHAPEIGDLRVPGIRSIWEGIHSKHVFTVMFLAQSKETQRELQLRKEAQAESLAAQIRSGQNLSELRETVKSLINSAQDDPIVKVPRERVLRGYKLQYTSRDGKYLCMDTDLMEERPVNINTIQWLVYDNVKYVYTK